MYSIRVEPAAQRALAKVDGSVRDRLRAAIALLAQDPRPPAARRLVGRDAWRVRIGDYRIIYEIEDSMLVVVVVALGHRGEVYSRWHRSAH